jgi:membrane protease subunit HflC
VVEKKMAPKNLAAFGIPCLVAMFLGLGSLFVVNEREQALVLQFGELLYVLREPGLHLKVPFVQDVVYYDKQILDLDISATEVTLGDQKRIVVDTFTRYRIVDPALFYKSVRNEQGAQGRLAALVTGSFRSVLGASSLPQILSSDRTLILKKIREQVNKALQNLGLQVVDVRIRRTDLPPENNQAIFRRMISERQKEAQEIRAEGQEKGQIIRAKADLECVTLRSAAEKTSEEQMGYADQKALEIVRQAFEKNPSFAEFYQSKEAYESSFDQNTHFVLTPGSNFLKYMNKDMSLYKGQK